jgi:hypothetical protein
MSNICVICNKQFDPRCDWSSCSIANKIKLTSDTVRSNPEYDHKFKPQWQQEIEKYPGRH